MANTLKFGNGQWAVKEGSTLAYNDENNNFKPLPFSFERDSKATLVNKDGLIEVVGSGVPRIDYKDDSKGALLLEPQRTNLSLYSQQFNLWGEDYVTVDQAISPDGNLTADELTKVSAFSAQGITQTGTSGVNYVFSLFVKPKTTNRIALRQASGSNDVRRYFDLSDESSGSSGGNQYGFVSEGIEKYPNGWYRVHTVCTSNGTAISKNLYAGMAGNTTYDGEVYIWGSQLEEGSYPTSYIPTHGSPVTRFSDVCEGAGNEQVFNDSEGVLYAEVKGFEEVPTISNHYITISSSTVSFTNAIILQFRNNGTLRLYFGGSASANIQFIDTSIDFTENNKIAVQYDSNGSNYKMFVNGVSISRYSLATNQSVIGLSELNFNYSNLNFNGNVKDVRYYNTALSDSELQALTR